MCEYAAGIKHRHKRWSEPSSALRIGTAFHKGLEAKLGGIPLTPLRIAGIASQVPDPKDAKVAQRLLSALEAFKLPAWKVLGIEKPFSMKVQSGMHEIVGRLDGIVEDEEGLWSLQGKTISSSKDIEGEQEKVRLSPHEITYHRLCMEEGIDLKGTILVLGVKLSKKAEDAGVQMIQIHKLPRSVMAVAKAWPTLFDRILSVANKLESKPIDRLFANTDNCLGQYGNSRCPLFVHCHHGASLSGTIESKLTMPLENRYGDLASDD